MHAAPLEIASLRSFLGLPRMLHSLTLGVTWRERAVADYLSPYPARSVFKPVSRGPIQNEKLRS